MPPSKGKGRNPKKPVVKSKGDKLTANHTSWTLSSTAVKRKGTVMAKEIRPKKGTTAAAPTNGQKGTMPNQQVNPTRNLFVSFIPFF